MYTKAKRFPLLYTIRNLHQQPQRDLVGTDQNSSMLLLSLGIEVIPALVDVVNRVANGNACRLVGLAL